MIKIHGVSKAISETSIEFRKRVELRKTVILNGIIDSLKEKTPVLTGKARDGWRLEGDDVVNDVEYISELNEGSSAQAPAFFVEQAVLNNPNVKINGTIVSKL